VELSFLQPFKTVLKHRHTKSVDLVDPGSWKMLKIANLNALANILRSKKKRVILP
jgi:hypothetical protein